MAMEMDDGHGHGAHGPCAVIANIATKVIDTEKDQQSDTFTEVGAESERRNTLRSKIRNLANTRRGCARVI